MSNGVKGESAVTPVLASLAVVRGGTSAYGRNSVL